MNKHLSVIILAAGSSSRFGRPKQFVLLAGLPVFLHSVRNFLPIADEMKLVVPPGQTGMFQTLTSDYGLADAKIAYVEGGNCRTDSVRRGLDALRFRDGIVAIHDAARPLASADLLRILANEADKYGAAAPVRPVADTVLQEDGDGIMAGTLPREHLVLVSTPQVFRTAELENAYAALGDGTATDDTQVFFRNGGIVKLVREMALNPKLTYPEDLELLELELGKLGRNGDKT